MFVTATMKHLVGTVLLDDADKVAKIFLKYGVIEPVAVKSLEEGNKDGLDEVSNTSVYERVVELRRHIETLLNMAALPLPIIQDTQLESMRPANLENCQKLVGKVDSEIASLRGQQQSLEEKIHQKKELLRSFSKNAGEFSNALSRFRQDSQASQMLRVRAGKVKKIFFQSLYQRLRNQFNISITYTQEDQVVSIKLVYLIDEEAGINDMLQQAQWIEVPLEDVIASADENSLQDIQTDLEKMEQQQKDIKKEIVERISVYKDNLYENWVTLHLNELYSKLEQSFSKTHYTCFFSGWIPEKSVKKVIASLKKATKGHIAYEIREAADVHDINGKVINPPTAMSNPKLLKPFESLVRTYSVPAYNTIDSTLPVAILFVVMFGLMFADAGHGLIVMLLGALTAIFSKKNNKDLGFLMIYCGLASIACGIMFGTYFGYQLTKPLWFDMESISNSAPSKYHLRTSIVSINDIFKLAIMFGMGVIYLSYLFNWINRLRRREFIDLFLERNGILGGWMYSVGIYLVWNYIASNYTSFGDTNHIGWILGLPMCLLFFSEPARYLFEERKTGSHPFKVSMIGGWIGHWLINIFEFIVNSLSNTISFIRVAGLGMAHIILMTTFYEMAENLPLPGYLTVVLLANVLVIGLEGLSAAINSVRLNYYEFFSRYFIGGGRLYQPVKLNG